MKYAKIENGQITQGPCQLPRNLKTADGWITGFNCLDAANLRPYGWVPVEYAGLVENQRHGTPIIADDLVFYPAESFNTEEVAAVNTAAAKQLRDSMEVADIEVHGDLWQVKERDRVRILETVGAAARMNSPAETTVPWILADNSIRSSTRTDLEAVLDAFSLRRQTIFTAYNQWMQGDKQEAFAI